MRTLLAGVGVAAALVVEHLLFYDPEAARDEPELALLGSNIMGVATIGAGVALAADDADEALRFAAIVGIAGAVVFVLRIVRRELRLLQDTQQHAGHAAGLGDGVKIYDQAYGLAAARTPRA
jgi:hypothetical protein